jgi:eukaryotic-like serine/threonine-protein kinase
MLQKAIVAQSGARAGLEHPQAVQDLAAFAQGRFAIRARLGTGGMGEVYLANDAMLKCDVALKRLAPRFKSDHQYRRQLLQEAQAQRASSLHDPHIAQIYDVLQEKDEVVLVMEYVEGMTLRSRMREPIGLSELLDIAVQCTQALVAAHEKGLLHCDIKPENIMLTPAGDVKMLDFGVAKRLPRSDQVISGGTLETDPDPMGGTPAYMAPEILLQEEADARADIFSLGVVLYEILAGRHPFLADSFIATKNHILHHIPTSLALISPQTPSELGRIVEKMLSKEAGQRYASGAELLQDLRRVQPSVFSRTSTTRGATSFRTRNFNILVTALSLVMALAAGAGYWVWSQYQQHRRVQEVSADHYSAPGPSPIRSILIIPFHKIGGSPDYDYFGVGLAEVLNAKLTNARLLEVRSSHGLGNTYGANFNPRDIGQRLSVDAVLSGSYQIEDGFLSFNFTLLDVRRDVQIAGNSFADSFTRAIVVEQKLAANVVDSLRTSLTPEERTSFETSPTQQEEAFQAYLRGNYEMEQFWKQPGPIQLARAGQYFNRVLQLDRHFTLALLSLARLHWIAAFWGYAIDPGVLARAEEESNRAIDQDPSLGGAYATRALVEFQRGQLDRSRESLRQAFARSPHSPLGYYAAGFYYMGAGLPDQSLSAFRRARELDPELVRREIGLAYRYQCDFMHAQRQLEQDLQAHPGDLHTAGALASVLVTRGDISGAQAIVRDLLRRAPEDPMVQYLVALLKATERKPFSIVDWLRRYQKVYWVDAGYCANVAGVCAVAQQPAQALSWLHRSGELGMRNYRFLSKNPLYANLQQNHQFQSYLESVRQQSLEEERREAREPLIPTINR